MNQFPVEARGCLKSSRSANATDGPITFLSRFHLTRGQVLAKVLGRPLFSESGLVRHCSDAMASGRVGKAVGDFTARRRSAKVRLGKTSIAKRHALEKRTVFTTRRRTHVSSVGYARRMRPVIPMLWDVAVFQNKCITIVKETLLICVYRPLVCHVRMPRWTLKTRNLKSKKIQH